MNELAIRILDPAEGHFLSRIEWNAEEFAGWMQELSDQYANAVIVTPDDYKGAKKDRAELNKVLERIKARRIEVKKAIMEPYEAFEQELVEATEAVDRIAGAIDKSIKDYEAAEKEAKRDRIRKMFDSEVQHPFYEQIDPKEMEFLEFDRIFDPKWLLASAKIAKVEKELNEKLSKIEEDLKTILTMDTEPVYRAGALKEYKRTLDLGAALKLHSDLVARVQKEQEAKRRREEEERRREAEAAERKRQQDVAALRERLSAEQPNPPAAPQPDNRTGAPVSGFQQRGYINPQTMPQNATQGQDGGKLRPSGADNNAERSYRQPNGGYEGAPETGGVVPMRNQAPPPQPPKQPEKTFFVEFRVEGTRDQLMALREYMNSSGLRYGPINKQNQ